MRIEQRVALLLLGASLLLGGLGEGLFRDASWGINIFLWVSALGVGAFALSRWFDRPIPRLVKYVGPTILLFAACFGFRDAPDLKFANGLALFLLIGALLVRTRAGNIAQSSIYDLTCRAGGAWFKLTSDFARLVVKDIDWRTNENVARRVQAIFKGLLIAAPLVLVFGGLFLSADDAFRTTVANDFSFGGFDGVGLLQSATIFLFCAVLAAGFCRTMLTAGETEIADASPPKPNSISLGFTEIAVVLGTLDALFLAFIVVQAQYFFGGVRHLKSIGGLTYAEYARHGFFELAAVAMLGLATILGFHSLLQEPERHRRSFTLLAGTLTAFVSVVLVSAFERMALYIDFAGLTELRLYTTACMGWTALALVWLAITVFTGNRSKFAAGAIAGGLAVVLVLNVINPDAMIARTNLGLANRQIDLAYIESLSVDAAPAVIDGVSKLSAAQSSQLRANLRRRWSTEAGSDWRGIDLGRWRYLTRYRPLL